MINQASSDPECSTAQLDSQTKSERFHPYKRQSYTQSNFEKNVRHREISQPPLSTHSPTDRLVRISRSASPITHFEPKSQAIPVKDLGSVSPSAPKSHKRARKISDPTTVVKVAKKIGVSTSRSISPLIKSSLKSSTRTDLDQTAVSKVSQALTESLDQSSCDDVQMSCTETTKEEPELAVKNFKKQAKQAQELTNDKESGHSNSQPTLPKDKVKDGLLLGSRKRVLPYSAINTTDRSGRTPIFKYAKSGDLESCRLLIENGADLNIQDHAGWTPLHDACLENHYDVTLLLLEHGADINAAGYSGDTPLHDSVSRGHVEITQLLLLYGASMDATNDSDLKPTDLIDNNECKPMQNLLREWKEISVIIHDRDDYGRTRLHKAASEGDAVLIEKLLRFGANVNATDNSEWSPLHESLTFGDAAVVAKLLEFGADVNYPGLDKQTPLHIACSHMNLSCIEILLQYGADPSFKNSSGKTSADLLDDSDQEKPKALALLDKSFKPFKSPLFKCRSINQQHHFMPTIPTSTKTRKVSAETMSTNTSLSNIAQPVTPSVQSKPQAHLTREERKLLAVLRTIETMENESNMNSRAGSYYVGYPGYEEYEASRIKRKSSVTSVKKTPRTVGGTVKQASTKRRGRPPKNVPIEDLSSQIDVPEPEDMKVFEQTSMETPTKAFDVKLKEAKSPLVKVTASIDEEQEFSIVKTESPSHHVSSFLDLKQNNSVKVEQVSLPKSDLKHDEIRETLHKVEQVSPPKLEIKQDASTQKLRKSSSISSNTELTSIENKAKFVIKKKQKKSFLSISGYQDMERPTLKPPPFEQQDDPLSVPIVSTPAPQDQDSSSTNCSLLYTFSFPKITNDPSSTTEYILDLQLGLIFGHASGRLILDKNPQLVTRLATLEEKEYLEKTLLSYQVLECMKLRLGENQCRWTKKIHFTSNEGKDLVGMRLSAVDLHFVQLDSAQQHLQLENFCIRRL